MLFKILKLFGLDVPARIAEVQAEFEERVKLAEHHVKQAAQEAGVLAALFVFASLASLSALGVGLIALYRWVLLNYGQFYGFAAVGGVLVLIAVILFARAMLEAKSWSAESSTRAAGKRLKLAADMAQVQAETVAQSAAAAAVLDGPVRPVLLATSSLAPTSASDLVEPLALILSKMIKFPTNGNPPLDELIVHLRGAARGAADEAVEGVVHAVRYGERTQLVAALGGAVFVGWLLACHRPHHVSSL
jgi:ABC-type multidrug transport system fused ATPase/permease subunit